MNDKLKNAFDGIRAADDLKQSTRAFIAQKSRETKKPLPARRLATALGCLLLVLLGAGGFGLYFTPVSAISIDVNPSVELAVNRFDQVISVASFNDDGAALAASVELKYMSYTASLDALLASDGMQSYLAKDALVSISVCGDTEAKSAEMLENVSQYAGSPNVECHSANRAEVEKAHAVGLSFGKYNAYLELLALDPSVTVEDVCDLSMRQIRNRIDALCGNDNGSGSG